MALSSKDASQKMRDLKADAALKPLQDPFWGELQAKQRAAIQQEMNESPKEDMQRFARVVRDMFKYPSPAGIGDIEWDNELKRFGNLPWPDYYLKPVHSVPGGWLSREAAMNNSKAMGSIYVDCHPHSCTGIYEELIQFIPADAKVVVDLGAGCGDAPAAAAKKMPNTKFISLDASQFMIIVGEKQNAGIPNLEFMHALAEDTALPSGHADCVVITLVLHECSNEGKDAIVREAYRILKPGGTFVLSDTPPMNLMSYRGFLEPYRLEWAKFNANNFLHKHGFIVVGEDCVTDLPPRGKGVKKTDESLFTRISKKPASKL